MFSALSVTSGTAACRCDLGHITLGAPDWLAASCATALQQDAPRARTCGAVVADHGRQCADRAVDCAARWAQRHAHPARRRACPCCCSTASVLRVPWAPGRHAGASGCLPGTASRFRRGASLSMKTARPFLSWHGHVVHTASPLEYLLRTCEHAKSWRCHAAHCACSTWHFDKRCGHRKGQRAGGLPTDDLFGPDGTAYQSNYSSIFAQTSSQVQWHRVSPLATKDY